ncbi:hypothetical protein M378DRAFT_162523 [Amanita muscaria Koide BX008]|uniref:Uncharacterized protein n=1 Tax=Amanita muscaria (strain Koide BX008) TaxID=946122 RepID=A0A0C2WTB3_AMAMK|nr:hypothetical protein M378DRAFT_162523 [Amanita muscaria Koide BX008]
MIRDCAPDARFWGPKRGLQCTDNNAMTSASEPNPSATELVVMDLLLSTPGLNDKFSSALTSAICSERVRRM